MGLTNRFSSAWKALTSTEERASPPPWFWDQLAAAQSSMALNFNQTLKGKEEEISASFEGLIVQAYQSNAVVFAVEQARLQLFMQARFQFQELRNGRPGKLFGSPALNLLEHPWPTGVTGDLLSRMLLDADFGGTAFNVRAKDNTIRRLRPDWVTMVLGSENDPDVQAGDSTASVLGVIYHPGGKNSGRAVETFLRESVSIFAPIPDPLASYRGMPWLMPVIREIASDRMLTEHKIAYLANGATPNLVVSLDKDMKEAANPAAFAEWIEQFRKANPTAGWDKFSTMYLAGGITVARVGSDMGSTGADVKQLQGAVETRIAAAGGVPPVIVGLSEGLQAATYSNYGQARRRFADNTMRPLWQNAAASLETLVPPPASSRLWYDDRDIQALAEDKKDLAEVRQFESQQIRTLVDGGYKPDSVVEAVTTGDFTRLVHTGLFSVQLQAPGTTAPADPPTPASIKAAVQKQIPASTKGA